MFRVSLDLGKCAHRMKRPRVVWSLVAGCAWPTSLPGPSAHGVRSLSRLLGDHSVPLALQVSGQWLETSPGLSTPVLLEILVGNLGLPPRWLFSVEMGESWRWGEWSGTQCLLWVLLFLAGFPGLALSPLIPTPPIGLCSGKAGKDVIPSLTRTQCGLDSGLQVAKVHGEFLRKLRTIFCVFAK